MGIKYWSAARARKIAVALLPGTLGFQAISRSVILELYVNSIEHFSFGSLGAFLVFFLVLALKASNFS